MSTKTGFAAALWLALLGAATVDAADPPSLLSPPEKIAAPAPVVEEAPPPIPGHAAYGPSEWISYHRADCCGPIGDDGPLNMEVYVRTGPSLPVAGELFAHTLTTGWMVQGGGRTLFFNPEGDAAWVIDLNLANIYNNGDKPNLVYSRFGVRVNTRSLNRTFVGFGGGRDWYLLGAADHGGGGNWRFGGDVGGRWGTARLDLNDIDVADGFERHSHVFGALYLGLHTDVEIPWGCCVFTAGLRAEWDYNWMNFIPNHNNDLQDVNLLLTGGIRF